LGAPETSGIIGFSARIRLGYPGGLSGRLAQLNEGGTLFTASRARVSRRMTDSPYPYARPWNRHAASGRASAKGLGQPRPKFAVAQLAHKADTQTAPAFLEVFVAAGPYRVEVVLTDNSVQFADLPKNRSKARRTRTSVCGWTLWVAGLYDEPRPDAPRRSATTSPRSFARPLRRRRGTQRTGACIRWRRPPGLRESTIHRIWRPSIFNPIAPRRSSFPPTLYLSRRPTISRAFSCRCPTRAHSVCRREEPD
jgi:hypothetical protein